MLQAIRNSSRGLVAKIIIGFICLVFALFGVEALLGDRGLNDAAKVNGEKISNQRLAEALFFYKRRLLANDESIDWSALNDDQLRPQVLEQLIDQTVVYQRAHENGFFMSSEQIDRTIASMPQFQEDGKFSNDLFNSALRRIGLSGKQYAELLKEEMLIGQFVQTLNATAFITEPEYLIINRFLNEKRDVRYLTVSHDRLVEQMLINEQAVATFYQENPTLFQTKEAVDVQYIELQRDSFLEQVAIPEDQIRALYDQRVDQWRSMQQPSIAHILIKAGSEGKSDEAIRAQLLQLKNKAQSGESFADLATMYSQDLGSKRVGGALGTFDADVFPEAFAQGVESLALSGGITDVIETDAGFHLIQVTPAGDKGKPVWEETRQDIRNELALNKADTLFWETVNQLKDAAFNFEDLKNPSGQLSLPLQTTNNVPRDGLGAGVFSHKPVLDQLFSQAVLQQGHNSDVVELSESHVVVVHVSEHHKATLIPYLNAKPNAVRLWKTQQARLKHRQLSQQVMESLKQGQDIKAVAQEHDLPLIEYLAATRQTLYENPPLMNAVFALPHADINHQAITAVTDSNDDLLVVSVNNVVSDTTSTLSTQQKQLLKTYMPRLKARQHIQKAQKIWRREADVVRYVFAGDREALSENE